MFSLAKHLPFIMRDMIIGLSGCQLHREAETLELNAAKGCFMASDTLQQRVQRLGSTADQRFSRDAILLRRPCSAYTCLVCIN